MVTQPRDSVSFCRTVGDETRLEILRLLQKSGEMCVNDIVAAFGRSSQPTISHHLKILKDEGLVTHRRTGKEIMYALNEENVAECCGQLWARLLPPKRIAERVASKSRRKSCR